MNKFTKSLTVPTIITCTLAWCTFTSIAIKENNKVDDKDVQKYTIEDIKKNSIGYQVESSFKNIQTEYERLKEEERKRLEELERQRLEKLENERQANLKQERLARIERERKLAEAKKAEQVRIAQANESKKQRQSVSRGSNESVSSNWMTFNASYYTAYCPEGCTGTTATGYNVSNTIYYNGLRIIATDPRVIKLGTIVEVKTPYETFRAIAYDTGGAIKGNKVDVLVSSEQEANKLGRHNVQIRVLKVPNKN
ncbi:3D domain-containing protein [Lysinibacillus sp. Bpr_S20]|uniref:3D domain-containing protein n=1 Tax=Lysinibacillus sp. Bpr_S20 TaxID=2933964 RepID=UPI002011ABC8|nr:3D domain-containing protein [Lysinibacillus sp. Bpr_S20]MCL1700702.1 3D domain-containing protein [Lysinibacillus sp. Bpr_S20]